MYLIKVLSYILFLILCILTIFAILLLNDFFFDKNIMNDMKLKKAQVSVITLTLSATIIKFFIEVQEKYVLISDFIANILVLSFSIFLLIFLFVKKDSKSTSKTQKGKSVNKNSKKTIMKIYLFHVYYLLLQSYYTKNLKKLLKMQMF